MGARIKLGLFMTEWAAGTFDGVNHPRSIDHYYLGAIYLLDYLAARFFIGGTEVLEKPRDMSNLDLPTTSIPPEMNLSSRTGRLPTVHRWQIVYFQ